MIWTIFIVDDIYIRLDPRSTCRGFSCRCCHLAWSDGESWEILFFREILFFTAMSGNINQGIYICSFMLWANGKGELSRVENKSCEWKIKAACLSCNHTYTFAFVLTMNIQWQENSPLWHRVNLWVSQTMFNHNQNLFLIVSYCFSLCGKFARE